MQIRGSLGLKIQIWQAFWLQLIIATDKTSIHRESNNNVPHILVARAPLSMSNSRNESISKMQIVGISICLYHRRISLRCFIYLQLP